MSQQGAKAGSKGLSIALDYITLPLPWALPHKVDIFIHSLIADSSAGVEITSSDQLSYTPPNVPVSTPTIISPEPPVAPTYQPPDEPETSPVIPSVESFNQAPNIHKLEPSFVNKNVQFSKPQLGHSSQGTPNPPSVLSLSQPQILNAGQPQILNAGQPQILNAGQPQIFNAGQPQILNAGQPEFFGTSQPEVNAYSGDNSLTSFNGGQSDGSFIPEILLRQKTGRSTVGQPSFQGQSFGEPQSKGSISLSEPQVLAVSQPQIVSVSQPQSGVRQLQPDFVTHDLRFGQQQQQQQFQSLDNHNPSFQTILESVDVRDELKTSKDSSTGQPLPVFSNSEINNNDNNNYARDQLLSGSNNIAQSQVQVSLPPPQATVQSSITNSGGEVGGRGRAIIQRGTLLGSTIGEVINPMMMGPSQIQADDNSSQGRQNQGSGFHSQLFQSANAQQFQPNVQFISSNSQQFQSSNFQQFESDENQRFQENLRLNNLGQSSFIGSSQGLPSQPETLSVSSPQVIGVSLPQPVSVSIPRIVASSNTFAVHDGDDFSEEDIEPEQLLRLSRSQVTSQSKHKINSVTSNDRKETKSLSSLEKMLEHSFGPDTEQDSLLQPPTRHLKTPDMSSLPLEKSTDDSSSPVFPPFSEPSPPNQQSTTIQKAILNFSSTGSELPFEGSLLEGSSFLGTVSLPTRVSQRQHSRDAHQESSRLPGDLSTSSSTTSESHQSSNKLGLQPESSKKTTQKRVKSIRVTTSTSARVAGPPRSSVSNSPAPSIQYESPGQRVFFDLGSPENDSQRSTRTIPSNRGAGNTLSPNQGIGDKEYEQRLTTRVSAQILTVTDKPNTKLPTTSWEKLEIASVKATPATTRMTLKTTTLPITTSRPPIRFNPTAIQSKDDNDDRNATEENSTEILTTTPRPIRFRPLVRRPGVRRRRVRPVNKVSNFNPRSRGGNKNVKKVSPSTFEITTPTEVTTKSSSTTASIFERAKLLNPEDILEKTTDEKKSSSLERLTVKGTRVTSSTTSTSPGHIKGINYASDTDSGIPFGDRINPKRTSQANTNTGSASLTSPEPTTNPAHNKSNYGNTNALGIRTLSNPSSQILQRITQLLPAAFSASSSPQIRASRMAGSSSKHTELKSSNKKEKPNFNTWWNVFLDKIARDKMANTMDSTEKFRPVPSLQFLRNLPPTTTVTPAVSVSPNLCSEETTVTPEPLASTSTSTSVSMSYTTVLDKAKVTTVLNTNHFLLSKKNRDNNNFAKALILSLQPPEITPVVSTTRTSLPIEFYSRLNKVKNRQVRQSET
ncbi:hypothetical protein FHG87_003117 [Trinorchestia longiramus]|nr:hypothetical protein FHG87_003117 [Trinorchestia longiramus]